MSVRLHRFRFPRWVLPVSLMFAAIFVSYQSLKPVLLEYASAAVYQMTYKAANDTIADIIKDTGELVIVEKMNRVKS